MTLLDSIIAHKKQEIRLLPDLAIQPGGHPSLVSAITNRNPSLIAEIKPVSPADGRLLQRSEVPATVKIFNRRAQAISVLCDQKFFGGGFDLLAEVRTLTSLPILAKEFILSEIQIRHAAAHGADAILLIAAVLSAENILQLAVSAFALGLDVLLELHTYDDAEKAAKANGKLDNAQKKHLLLGINNRDLETGEIDLRTTVILSSFIKDHFPGTPIISESGIRTPDDVGLLATSVQGFLIGTSLLDTRNRPAVLSIFSKI